MRRSWFILALAAGCGGGNGPMQGPSEPPPQLGSVRGTVVDGASAAVAGAGVQLTRPGQSSRSATTNGAGVYTFSQVQAGTWTVTAEPPAGYAGQGSLSTSVQVSAGAEASVPAFVMTRTAPPPPAGDVTVNIVDNAFEPPAVTIAAGRSVRWVNTGQQTHNSVGAGNAWSSPLLSPGQSFERTFPQAGTFTYECTLHAGMTGTVTVQ